MLQEQQQSQNNNIYEPNKTFNFAQLSLAQPTGIQGGAYFTKIAQQNKPLYIETPRCLTKQGFIKNGKKMFVDLMFNNNDEEFIHWIENLESTCQKLIFEKSESWFQNKLETDDIETAFTSPLRVYKSGKYYLVRVNVKMNYITNNPHIKIYSEGETPLTIDEVNSDTTIISIVEVQGIKFTSRNFQIDMELKQVMVLNTDKIFENCLIKSLGGNSVNIDKIAMTNDDLGNLEPEHSSLSSPTIINSTAHLEQLSESILNSTVAIFSEPEIVVEQKMTKLVEEEEGSLTVGSLAAEPLSIELKQEQSNNFGLEEFDINSTLNSLETITLKKPNQVYYEIYKEARRKAKKAKREAVVAFLEAKNIKKTYMLDDFDESDSDSEDSNLDNMSDDEEDEEEELNV